MDEFIRPYTHIALRLPSNLTKVVEITPNTTISIGKYGSFQSNDILGRPYHITFEILDKPLEGARSGLRIVPAAELHEHIVSEDQSQSGSTPAATNDGVEYEVVNPEGKVVMRTNQNIMDDPGTQKLSSDDIEALKREETASGKDVIAKILASHSALDKKTAFGLAKYTLRKTQKFMRRFTVLPLDVTRLANYFLYEKDAPRIMEIREEMLALICSWSNIHCGGPLPVASPSNMSQDESDQPDRSDLNNWLVVDETGGLIVAALAERMGILYPATQEAEEDEDKEEEAKDDEVAATARSDSVEEKAANEAPSRDTRSSKARLWEDGAMFATHNTITLLHSNSQPNLSLLSYFSYDSTAPDPHHPLHSHLKTLTWLLLLDPQSCISNAEPTYIPPETLETMKASKRGAYYRKRRRWARTAAIGDGTRKGGFAGLVVASAMAPASVLRHTVPLLRGGAQVVLYSASLEPLEELADYYSKARRAAFLTRVAELLDAQGGENGEFEGEGEGEGEDLAERNGTTHTNGDVDDDDAAPPHNDSNTYEITNGTTKTTKASVSPSPSSSNTPLPLPLPLPNNRPLTRAQVIASLVPSAEFPLDPTLLLATTVYTCRARPWQVLPGRTHPLMTGRGGSEGYVFVGTRVLPAEERVEGRGTYRKRQKTNTTKRDGGGEIDR